MPTRAPTVTRGTASTPCVNCGAMNAAGALTCVNCQQNPSVPTPAIGLPHQSFDLRNFLRRPVVVVGIVIVALLCVVVAGFAYWRFMNLSVNAAEINASAPAEEEVASEPIPVESINVMPGEEIHIACGLTVVVPDLKETTEQTFTNPQTGCSTTVRWVINNP